MLAVVVNLTSSFLAALRVSDVPGYRLAVDAGLDPTLLTKLVRGQRPIREHHAVALDAIARRLGVPRAVMTRGRRRGGHTRG